MVLGVFSSMDLFLFYLFFEVGLVPMYFLIGIWGGDNRLYAAIKFFLYTLVGSVVMLLGVIKIYFLTQDTALTGKVTQATINLLAGNSQAADLVNNTVKTALSNPSGPTGNFNILYLQAIGSVMPMGTMQVLLFFAFALGFAIKVPMFPFHTWLPDAHVEAPTAASVILAGVLLQMGTYGFIRFSLPLLPEYSRDSTTVKIMVWLSIIAIVYGALVSLMQRDMKKLIAYSSVSHLGFCTLGIFALNPHGLSGSVIQQINHGISTGALFLIVGLIYERRHTREIKEFGGLSNVMPVYATLFMIVMLSSIGLPLLNGF